MTTTDIRENETGANWLRVASVGGLVQINRMGKDGDVIQALTVLPEELLALLEALESVK